MFCSQWSVLFSYPKLDNQTNNLTFPDLKRPIFSCCCILFVRVFGFETRYSVCCPVWPQTQGKLLTSASWVLGLQCVLPCPACMIPRLLIIKFLFVYVLCLHVWLHFICVPVASKGWKKASDPLELQKVVSCHVHAGTWTQVCCTLI